MAPRRPPVVDPDEIRDDWNTRPKRPYRGRRGANPEGRTSKTSAPAEAPTEAPRPWIPARPTDWPTLAQIYDWGPAPYSMDSVRETAVQ